MKKNLALSITAALVVGVAGIGMAHAISLPNGGSLENEAKLLNSTPVTVNVNVAKYGSFKLTADELTLNFDAPDTHADMGEVLSTPVGYEIKANCPVKMTVKEYVSSYLVINRDMNRLKVWPNNLGTDQEWVVAIQPVIDSYSAARESQFSAGYKDNVQVWGVETYQLFEAGPHNGNIYLMGTWRFDTDTAAGADSKDWYTLTSGTFEVPNGIVATVEAQ